MPYFCTLMGILINLNYAKLICLILPLMLLSIFGLNAQTQTQAEWQQSVNHTIDAKLNPETNILSINQDLTYFNNSPDELSYIYFHIWPQAFSNKQTPFGQESFKNGLKAFVHAPKFALSKISNVSFSTRDSSLSYSPHKDYGNEVLKVDLNKPLKSGQSLHIKNTISIFIPEIFSRFGTNEGFYSMTQWYPKPAVYDVNGWNVFPYKGIGEYYSEYGRYKVSISLPSHYVVAATGELKTDTEIEWLEKLAKGKSAPRDSNTIKTIYYEQDSIHDFAWFAASGMKVSKETFTLGSQNVTAWSFIDQSKNYARGSEVVDNIIKGLKYYSKRVGNYPYKHCSAVIGPLEGAGGMEYPMVTICESDNAGTIVHEVGHNWFQGLLGSNEREYPWMDESINTFYQNQQQGISMKYLRQDKFKLSQSNVTIPALVLGAGAHQSTGEHSHAFSNTNYGVSVYMNGPLQFMYLQEILGQKLFDSCMQEYFKKFKFKHPLPLDIQAIFEKVSGKNLNWFFKGVISGKPQNFKLKRPVLNDKGGYEVQVKNKSNIPVSYQFILKGVKQYGHTTTNTILLPKGAYNLAINPNGYLLETNLNDNYANITKADPHKKYKLSLFGVTTRGLNSHLILPNLVTYNMHDGYSPGLFISNFHIPRNGLEYNLAPSYGLRSKAFIGQGRVTKSILEPRPKIQRIQIGLAATRYSFYPIEISTSGYKSKNLNIYNRIRPEVQFLFNRKNHWQSKLDLDYSYIIYDKSTYEITNILTGLKTVKEYNDDKQRNIFNARFSSAKMSKYNPMGFSFELSHDLGAYSRGIAQVYYSHIIPNVSKNKINYRIHLFAVLNDIIDYGQYHTAMFLSAPGMASDAAFKEVSQYRNQNRSADVGRFANMYTTSTIPSIRFPMPISVTGNYMLGFNTQSHFLPLLPIQFYFDGAFASSGLSNSDRFWWTSGLTYGVFDGHTASFEVSLPLIYSQNIKDRFSNNYNIDIGGGIIQNPWKWYQLFQFKLNLKFNKPDNIIRKIVTK